jgi:Family of unknown function (DUF5689)
MKKLLGLIAVGSILLYSCEKDFDDPIIKTVSTGSIKTIADIRVMHVPGETVYITDDISVYGVVTIDESSGNLYKESYITDETGNLYLRFTAGSGLFIGDSVRINLKGSKILKYNQMLQVDSLHPDNSVVKISTQNFKTPELVNISDLFDANNNILESSQGKLIRIDNSFFIDGAQGLSYADGATQTAGSRNIITLAAEEIEVRTSGYANFADDILPTGVGNFIGVVNQYNSDLQLLIRDPSELAFTGNTPILKTFNDESINSGGWSTQVVIGTLDWATSNQGASFDDYYVVMSNFINPTNFASETWLISPSNDFSTSTNPILSFKNAANYSGANLEVLVSTDYDGSSLPVTATWTPVSVNLSTGGFEFVPSGIVDLSSFLGASTYIAFKYTGTSFDGKTWEIDNIIINK